MQEQFEWHNLDGRRHSSSTLPGKNEEKVDMSVDMLVEGEFICSDIYVMDLW